MSLMQVLLGSTVSYQICATAAENGTATLTAPAGTTFTSVEFASWGTPTGTCGSFAIGGCHAVNSKTVVEGYLLGQSGTINIPANNTVFEGDPCGGTPKNLYVQATASFTSDGSTSTGQVVFSTPGTTTWTVPAGVFYVSVVCIGGGGGGGTSVADGSSGGGGGGLGWKNNIPVTPGQVITVVVGSAGAVSTNGGRSYFSSTSTVAGNGGVAGSLAGVLTAGGAGGTFVGTGGGDGGQGGSGSTTDATNGVAEAGAGGGAGGYAGNGGQGAGAQGGGLTGGTGSGGAAGGGGSPDTGAAGGGGGTGLLGQGTSGAGGVGSAGGGGGSGGVAGTVSTGGIYGGGGAGADSTASGSGAQGAVRIIWGVGRAYPSTGTADV